MEDSLAGSPSGLALAFTLVGQSPLAGTTELTEVQPRAQRLRSVINWQSLVPLLEGSPGVAAVSPMVTGAGLALRGEAVQSIALVGVDLDRYDRIVGLRAKVVNGSPRLAPGESIVGRELAHDLGVRVGDRFSVQTGSVSDVVRVTALVDLGVRDLNRRTVIVPLRTSPGSRIISPSSRAASALTGRR